MARVDPECLARAVASFDEALQQKSLRYDLATYESFNKIHKLRSKAYSGYSFLVHKNSMTSAGWMICVYSLSGCCPMEKAVRRFDVSKGGTSTLSRHTDQHQKEKNSDFNNKMKTFQKLSTGERDFLAKAAVKALVQDQLPFNFLQQNGIRLFVKAVFEVGQRTALGLSVRTSDLTFSPPTIKTRLGDMVMTSREQFSRDILPTIVGLGGGLTCDGLKHKLKGDKYYDLVAHWVEYKHENIFTNRCEVVIKSQVLMLECIEGSETAENIRKALNDGLARRYGIDLCKLLKRSTFVTDCASTLPCVVGASSSSSKVPLSSKWMGCIAHQLNTCMKKVLGEKRPDREPFITISANLQAAKTIIRILKQSDTKLPSGLKVIQEVETRFSTIFFVVQRFLRCAQEIKQVACSESSSAALAGAWNELDFATGSDGLVLLRVLNAAFIVLKPLKIMQTAMEASLKPTLHRLIPMLEYCKEYLTKVSEGNMLTAMVPSMEEAGRVVSSTGVYCRELAKLFLRHLCELEIHPLWSAGCLLHPRLCLMTCVKDFDRREMYMRAGKKEIRELMKLYSVETTTGDEEVTDGQKANERSNRRLEAAVGSQTMFSLETALDCPQFRPREKDELTRYLQSPFPFDCDDIMDQDDLGTLRWWARMRKIYPILHKVAFRVLATPASSCASERDFSMVNNTASAISSKISLDMLDKLVYSYPAMQNKLSF